MIRTLLVVVQVELRARRLLSELDVQVKRTEFYASAHSTASDTATLDAAEKQLVVFKVGLVQLSGHTLCWHLKFRPRF